MITAKEMMKEAGFQLSFNCPLNDSIVYMGKESGAEVPEYEGSVIEIRRDGTTDVFSYDEERVLPLTITPAVMKAIIQQLKEFGFEVE